MTPYKKNQPWFALITLLAGLTLSACGGGGGGGGKKVDTASSISTSLSSSTTSGVSSAASSSTLSSLKDQTITFTDNQPTLIEGNKRTDSVRAQGIGKVFYISSNTTVANVSDAGEVTAIAPGQTIITATIAQDHVYNQASVSHTIKIVPKPIEISVWISSNRLIVDLPQEAEGYYLYRTRDKNCDLTKVLECYYGAIYQVHRDSIRDYISVADGTVYYSLVKGDQKATVAITATATDRIENAGIKPVEFNHKLWRISSQKSADNSYSNAMSYSTNSGRSWTTLDKQPEFPPRAEASLISFNNKLWVFGGWKTPNFSYPNLYNDAWSSTDGLTWQLEYSEGISSYTSYQYPQFDNKLWRISGWNVGITGSIFANNSISNSADGASWNAVTPIPSPLENSIDIYPNTTVFNDKLWILFKQVENQISVRKLWSSVDGIQWALSSTLDADSDSSSFHDRMASFNNKIWIFSSPTEHTVLARSSADGINWDSATTNLPSGINSIINFNNGLLAFTNEAAWFSTDAIQWDKGFVATFDFSQL